MADQTTPTRSDAAAWLNEYQKLVTNVRWWINHGNTETATREIDATAARWRDAPE